MNRLGGPHPFEPLKGTQTGAQAAVEPATAVRPGPVAAACAGSIARRTLLLWGRASRFHSRPTPGTFGPAFTVPTTQSIYSHVVEGNESAAMDVLGSIDGTS
jgi:hypothetical protein